MRSIWRKSGLGRWPELASAVSPPQDCKILTARIPPRKNRFQHGDTQTPTVRQNLRGLQLQPGRGAFGGRSCNEIELGYGSSSDFRRLGDISGTGGSIAELRKSPHEIGVHSGGSCFLRFVSLQRVQIIAFDVENSVPPCAIVLECDLRA